MHTYNMDILGALGIQLGNAGFEFGDEQSEHVLVSQMQGQLEEHPDLDKAIRFKRENSLCNPDSMPFPVCSTTPKNIGSYSIGLELYFLFLKQMMLLFFLVSLISACPIYVNYQGDYFEVKDPIDASAAVSLGNLKSDTDHEDDVYFAAWFSNFCYTCLLYTSDAADE